MRYLAASFIILASFFTHAALSAETGVKNTNSITQKSEIQKEIERLTALQEAIRSRMEKNRLLLDKVKKERAELDREKEWLSKEIEKAEQERYKKIAKVFEKMEPEFAGEKITKISDPQKAAFIIFNMKARSAGAAMNYVEPERVSDIVKILTELKDQKKETP